MRSYNMSAAGFPVNTPLNEGNRVYPTSQRFGPLGRLNQLAAEGGTPGFFEENITLSMWPDQVKTFAWKQRALGLLVGAGACYLVLRYVLKKVK